MIAHSMLNRDGGKVELGEVIAAAEGAGWKHSLTTYDQKRKHFYEVMRRARVEGKSSAYLLRSTRSDREEYFFVDPSKCPRDSIK